MTEEEWPGSQDPQPMLGFLRGKASGRKFMLFVCGCLRADWHLLQYERTRVAAERYKLDRTLSEVYLVAGDGGEPRLYRVSRFRSVAPTGLHAVRPANLDLEKLWEELRRRVEERGSGVLVTLRVRPEALDRLLRVTASQLTGPAEHDSGAGGPLLKLPFVAEGAARGVLLGFGVDVEVMAPQSLRAEMRGVAAAVVALYSD